VMSKTVIIMLCSRLGALWLVAVLLQRNNKLMLIPTACKNTF
jgi:hypothetical protein